MFYRKISDPELECKRCEGTGQINETTPRGFGGSSTVFGPCEICNGSGMDPTKKPLSVQLTPNEITHLTQALFSAKDILGDEEPGDAEKREMYRRLYTKFSALV